MAFIFERVFLTPPFTREHVNALTEHTNMNTSMIKKDLDFQPTPLNEMLDIIIEQIQTQSKCPLCRDEFKNNDIIFNEEFKSHSISMECNGV